ncbi:hypothetical protein [Streptomyces sp. NPDC059564]|uniref:hypothetical protein n=1 Tax=Streptomyces sp. NPDC059564 TaxID=3346865 RepID=UPI0036C2D2CB
MKQWGAGVPWHVLERVPAGQEEMPALLRGLVTFGQRRHAWLRLEEKLGWATTTPLFAHAVSCLFEMLTDLDERRLIQVLDFLARRGHGACRTSAGVHSMTFTVFTNGGRHVLPLVASPAAGVRTGAAWVLRTIRCADPAALDALRRQAAVEDDTAALTSQLLAVGRLSRLPSRADPAETAETSAWLRPWLEHQDAQVRLAAAQGILSAGDPGVPGDAAGTGLAVASALAATGGGRLPDVPWWPRGYDPVKPLTHLLAPHPQEAAALVETLAGHTGVNLRRAAVATAGARLRYWRDPGAELWETVAAGIDDEAVAGEALDVFARGGAAAAPYADRLVRYVERSGDSSRSHSVGVAVRGLVGMGDDRAAGWYGERCGDHFVRVDSVPERWAPKLLPGFRTALAAGSEDRGGPEILRILAQWGPAAAPAAPELAAMLDTPAARPAAEVLGRIGQAAGPGVARAVAGVLAGLAGAYTERSGYRWQGSQTAAWAHWRVTGDPERALRVCGAAVRAGHGRPVLRYLADLGPLAAPYADAVRPLLTCPGEWSRVGAAHAWWRITGDAAPALAALLPELAPLVRHSVTPLVVQTVRVLGAIGRPAVAALPVLHQVTVSPRRYGGDILRDEELCRAAREAIAAIGWCAD